MKASSVMKGACQADDGQAVIVSANFFVSTEPFENVGHRVLPGAKCYRDMDKKAREFAIFNEKARWVQSDLALFHGKRFARCWNSASALSASRGDRSSMAKVRSSCSN